MRSPIDDKWFKAQQKRVGVTAEDIARRMGRDRSTVSHIYTGRIRMSLEWAKAFAEVLDVPLSEVLERAGVADAQDAKLAVAPGFSESDATPFGPRDKAPSGTAEVAAAFGARPGVDVWMVRNKSMELAGYHPGDFILVDTHASERVKAGDFVIAQVYSRNGGAKTVFRKWMPPVLIACAAPTADEPVYVVDGDNVVIRGKISASWRLS